MDIGWRATEFCAADASGPLSTLGHHQSPQSPVAWATFATGCPPGAHGIFDFLRRDLTSYAPDFSIAEVVPPEHSISAFGYTLPLSDPVIRNRRQGTPFWSELESRYEMDTTVLRVPVTFPPDPIHRMLSGMGIPDLLGTQGTYTLFSTRPRHAGEGGRIVQLPPLDAPISSALVGPAHPLKADAPPLQVPLMLEPGIKADKVSVLLGDTRVVLTEGVWSDWVEVRFEFAPWQQIPAMVRLYLIASFPDIELYVSPLHFDPRNSPIPISSPHSYASELAASIGLYHTLGMPEETWSLNSGHLPDAAYLAMVESTVAEREAMLMDALSRRDSEVVVSVFVQPDRVSHMFWREIDTAHPLHGKEPLAREGGAIKWIYRDMDRILGRVLAEMAPADDLVVLSDHGFTSYRRRVHLNRWLVAQGFMVLKPGFTESEPLFSAVDWRRTQAYALGFNGVFINLSGREPQGSVAPDELSAVKQAIREQLMQLTDTASDSPAVMTVYDGANLYAGGHHAASAPDLVVGYEAGYRASWQTALGGVPATVFEDNESKWSGDHLVDPTIVPGVLLTSFTPAGNVAGIADVTALVKQRAGQLSANPFGPASPTTRAVR